MTVAARPLLAGFAILLVIAGISGGLYILGSPGEARVNRLDERRVRDLQEISALVNVYFGRQGHLPAALEELSIEPGMSVSARDPVTRAPYPYRTVDERTFEICAVFEAIDPRAGTYPNFWLHGMGRQCFRPMVDDARLR